MTSLISIITTTYNREQYLSAAIESILAQTYPNFELIIWDDGSTDSSLTIARKYAKQDARIQVTAAPHQGRGIALKAAHTLCKGTYIGWVDSDDLLAPTALEETAAVLDAQPEIGIVYTDCLTIDEKTQVKGLGHRSQIPYSPDRLLVDFMTFHFRLFRHQLYDRIGGINSEFNRAEDYDFCLRLSEITQFYHLNKPLYYYRQHSAHTVEQQLDQIIESQSAISQALHRRGLSERFELEVDIVSRFFLYKRKQKEICCSKSTASNPIFVIGAPRSGTTLLRLMLTAHPDICIPPESLFFVALEPKYGNVSNLLPQIEEFLNDLYNEKFPKFCEWNVDRKFLLNNLKSYQELSYPLAVETVYQTYRQQFDSTASIWGDKNPCHIHHLEKIRRYFPASKVILIVRDFRACYSSVKKIVAKEREMKEVWSGPKTLEGMMYQWNQVVKLIGKYHQKWEQFYLVYYEDLVREPSVQLTKICKWLGVDFQDSMLEFYQKNAELGLVLPSQVVLNPNTFKSIDIKRINAWQNELSLAEVETIELMNRKNLERLGYKCTSLF
ncbi:MULTISPECIES: sulfotransferase [unclassified Microcoleus]